MVPARRPPATTLRSLRRLADDEVQVAETKAMLLNENSRPIIIPSVQRVLDRAAAISGQRKRRRA
jgi:hypothetical protein